MNYGGQWPLRSSRKNDIIDALRAKTTTAVDLFDQRALPYIPEIISSEPRGRADLLVLI